MKKRFIPLFALFATGVAFAGNKNLTKTKNGATARLQVIHNSADAAAKTVDVYAGSTLLINDFDFREATPYIDVPAGVDIRLGFAPSTSSSVNDTLPGLGQTVQFEANKTYVAVASGNIQNTYAANPNGISTKFGIIATEGSEQTAGGVGLKFLHGASDAPAVDIDARGVATLESDIKFNEFSTQYIGVQAAKYIVDINVAGTSTTVATYIADLSSLGGGSAVVFASGFLNPAANNNGAEFGVFVALPDGKVLELKAPSARLQVIHNSADEAANTVDVYAGSDLLIDDFEFRSATPFIDVPAETNIRLGFAAANSTSVNDTIAGLGQTVKFVDGKTYVAVATGNIQNTYAANPNSISTKFGIIATEGSESSVSGVGLKFLHGSSDAPAVDIIARGALTLASNLKFNEFTSSYGVVPANKYIVDINLAGTNTTAATYIADLSTLNGGSAVVFASGFIDTDANNNGAEFGVFVALPDGSVFELKEPTARLQVIHNSADAAAQKVDVYAGSDLLINDFEFREATEYIDVPAETNIRLGFAPNTSSSVNDTIAGLGQTVKFENSKTYVAVANGVIQNTYTANPDGISTKFGIVASEGSESSVGGVGLKFLHGVTDAPAVDILARNVGPLATNLKFNQFTSSYSVVPASKYVVDVNAAGTSITVVSYDVDLNGLTGGSAVVFASGFLFPGDNNNGADFGVFAALPDGTVIQFGEHNNTSTGIEDATVASINVYPNPSADVVTVNGEVSSVMVVNQLGQVVKSINLDANKSFEVADLNAGLYTVLLKSNAKVYSTRLSVVK